MNARTLIKALKDQREQGISGNVYWQTQIDFAYNTNHIEGSKLTHAQTRYIFETGTVSGENIPVDDAVEVANHFRMFDYLLDHIDQTIDKSLIQDYQRLLKTGTAQAADPKYNIGGWKLLNNAVGDIETIDYRHVDEEIGKLLGVYNTHVAKGHAITLTQIAAFHARFEQIHPFLDGNGRTGRIIMFQQCLQADIMPFIVMDETKDTYYHALDDWQTKGVVEPLLNYFEECQARYENICEYYLEGKELLVDLGRTDVQLDYRKLFDGQDS